MDSASTYIGIKNAWNWLNRSDPDYTGGNHVNELQKSEAVSVSRREFCRKAVERTSIVAAAAAAAIAYEKPAIRSFLGVKKAYATFTTARAGKFSLKGDSN